MAQRRRRAGLRDGRARRGNSWGPKPAASPLEGGPGGPRRPRRAWPWVLLAVLLVALVPAAYVGYNLAATAFTISRSDPVPNPGGAAPPGVSLAPQGTVTVLLMGSDERRDSHGNIVSGDVPHSDTMILAAIDTDHHAVRLLSIPRDLLVSIPGYGAGHRVNEAYTIGETQHLQGGGAGLAVRTVEQLTGVRIPYYAVITFDGFRQGVDAVGGVTIDVERPITDHDYPGDHYEYIPVYIPAGRQLMSGEQGLEYVRSRHDDPLSDFGRNQRQQHFLNALSAKVLKPERIGQFTQFLDIIKSNMRTNLSPAEMLALGNSMVVGGRPKLQSYAIGPNQVRDPTGREAALYGAVLIPRKAAVDALIKAFLGGEPAPGGSSSASPGA